MYVDEELCEFIPLDIKIGAIYKLECKKEMEGSTVRIQQDESSPMVICNPTVEYRVVFKENSLTVGLKVENRNGDIFEEAAKTGEDLEKLGPKVEKLLV